MKKNIGWDLDYSWARRGGKWKESTDLLLEGKIFIEDKKIKEYLEEIIKKFESSDSLLDNEKIEIFYEGGMQGYLIQSSPSSVSIYLHSFGQDSFDCLNYYSVFFEKELLKKTSDFEIEWIEHEHKRKKHKLKHY